MIMNADANKLLGRIWAGKTPDAWWATDKPDDFVLEYLDNGPEQVAYRVTVEAIPIPELTPVMVDEGEGPHPFGWSEGIEGGQA